MKIQITNLLGAAFMCPYCPTIPAASRITLDVSDKDYNNLNYFTAKKILQIKVIEEPKVEQEIVKVLEVVQEKKELKLDLTAKTAAEIKSMVMSGKLSASDALTHEQNNDKRKSLIQWLTQFEG